MSNLNHMLIPNDDFSRRRLIDLLEGVEHEIRGGDFYVTGADGDRLWEQLVEEGFTCDLGVIGCEVDELNKFFDSLRE